MLASELRERTWRIDDLKLREAVTAGIDLMTMFEGEEWPDRVNVDTLMMSACDNCIVGQVYDVYDYRDYTMRIQQLGIPQFEAHRFGFDINSKVDDTEDGGFSYWELDEAWREVLCG